ncbi:LabA-like NYN domain-containing protein [Hydrogenobaculum acidophilum]
MEKEKVIVFIDGSNVFHGLKNETFKIDYLKLVEFLTGDRYLVRAYFYSALPNDKDMDKQAKESFSRQKKFLEDISFMGIKVKLAKLRKLPDGTFLEKEVDIMLATDMLSLAYKNAYDTCVLVSGDSDFSYTVETVQSLGKRVENATFKKTSSYSLRKLSDKFLYLDDYIDKFLLKPKEPTVWDKIKNVFKINIVN